MRKGGTGRFLAGHNGSSTVVRLQIGNLQAIAQFLCNASKSVSGTLADILSPARMVIFGTLLTTLNKPMFALSGYVFATFGTVATLYWITAGEYSKKLSFAWCSGAQGFLDLSFRLVAIPARIDMWATLCWSKGLCDLC